MAYRAPTYLAAALRELQARNASRPNVKSGCVRLTRQSQGSKAINVKVSRHIPLTTCRLVDIILVIILGQYPPHHLSRRGGPTGKVEDRAGLGSGKWKGGSKSGSEACGIAFAGRGHCAGEGLSGALSMGCYILAKSVCEWLEEE